MKIPISAMLITMSLGLTINVPVFAEGDKPSALEKTLNTAQKAFDEGHYPKAERAWLRAKSQLSKNEQPDEQYAKLLEQLGQCYEKEGKFADAEVSYKQSIDILKGLSLDPADALSKLQNLSNVYRAISLNSFGDVATSFANQVGAIFASALNQDDKHHIDINLKQKFQQGIKEFIESAPENSAAEPPESSSASSAANDSVGTAANAELPTPTDAPPVKQVRLDKKIAFDLIRDADGKFKIANIQGVSLDVGLWVKLKQFAMLLNENKSPIAEVTAGAFGVEKVVKLDLPEKLYGKLKEGLNKFDPFFAGQPAAAAELSSGGGDSAASPLNSTSSNSVDYSNSTNASNSSNSIPNQN